MAKGKVTIDIKKTDYVYINGETGEELTKEQFNAKHGGLRNVLGAARVTPTITTGTEGGEKA